ncbi:MAG: ACP phosphodiesterase [Bacteroidota bacterium]
MNFLAHLYLSGENRDVIIGNFIADHVKGSKVGAYSPGVRAGISLHRAIDLFTDNHPVVRASVERIRPDFHKYAGVVVDMYFDHFLSGNWNDWSGEPLKLFTARMYSIIIASEDILPLRTLHMLPYMKNHDWLVNYGNFEGLDRALSGMARRTPFFSNMETAAGKLRSDYEFYQESFVKFFPELISHSNRMRDEIVSGIG